MGIGTLVQTSGLVEGESYDYTKDSIAKEISSPEEQLKHLLLENEFGPELFFRKAGAYYAGVSHFASLLLGQMEDTSASEWGSVYHREISEPSFTIWDSPKMIGLLEQPLGSSIDLTFEEAEEIVRLAAGRRPDLSPGKDYQKEVRDTLGHSLADRIRKAE